MKKLMYALMIVALGTTMSFAQKQGKAIARGVKAAENAAVKTVEKGAKIRVPYFKTPNLPKIYVPAYNATRDLTIRDVSRVTHNPTAESALLTQMHKATLETKHAYTLLNTLMKDPLYYITSEEGQKAGLALIDETVTNRSLRAYLRNDLLSRDVRMLVEDLVNYYTLSRSPVLRETPDAQDLLHMGGKDAFVDTAFNYLLMHPHKVNLKLRHMMQSPLVSNETKGAIQHFINMPEPNNASMAEKTVLRGALADAYTQYARGVQAAKTSDDIKETVAVYARTLTELQAFVKANNRLPKWNTTDNNELMLQARTEMLMQNSRVNNFDPVLKISHQIKELLAAYAPVYPTEQETLNQLKVFVRKNKRFPQSRPGNHNPVSDEESALYDAIMHWVIKGNNLFQATMNEVVRGL